jgi:hypothetical protein
MYRSIYLVETHLDLILKSRSVVKINVCTLTSVANVPILDERRPTREKRKGDEVICMTKLDALRIQVMNMNYVL